VQLRDILKVKVKEVEKLIYRYIFFKKIKMKIFVKLMNNLRKIKYKLKYKYKKKFCISNFPKFSNILINIYLNNIKLYTT